MKKLSLWTAAVFTFFASTTNAQTSAGVPQAFPYSSQVRDASGNILANQFINLRITMHTGSTTGPAVYIETDTVTTSPNGIFSVVVGGGTIVSGRFDSIPWSVGQIYQQVELDPAGGRAFTDMGTTQLLSLPYALAAGNGVTDVKYDSTGKLTVTSADGSTAIKSTAASWMTNGNSGVGSGFIGTNDNADLVFKRGGSEGLRLKSAGTVTMPGKLGVGISSPATSLDLNGGLSLRDTTVNVSADFNLNIGNRALIFINSSTNPGNARPILGPGLVKGQVVVLVITGSSNSYGVRFINNGTTYNTRVNVEGGGVNVYNNNGSGNYINYTEGNSLTLLWNGYDWVQIASSIGRP